MIPKQKCYYKAAKLYCRSATILVAVPVYIVYVYGLCSVHV